MNEFGNLLKELRGKRSVREVSKEAGLSHTYLSTLENGYDPRTNRVRKPTPETLKRLAAALNAEYSYLMFQAGYAPSPAADFGEKDREIFKLWLPTLQKILPNELNALKEKYHLLFEGNLTLGTLEVLQWKEPTNSDYRKFLDDFKKLIEDAKSKGEIPGSLLDLKQILSGSSNVAYKGENLSQKDKRRILDMLEVLFPQIRS